MSDIVIRPFQHDDLPGLAEAATRAAAADGEESTVTAADLEHQLDLPTAVPERDCLVAVLPDGKPVGYVVTSLFSPPEGFAWGNGTIDPAYRRRGVGTMLLRAAEARILERAETEVAPENSLYIRRSTLDSSLGEIALLESEGYRVIHSFVEMRIILDEPVAALPLPDGITLRPFDAERDAYTAYQADMDLFRDSWWFVEVTFDDWRSDVIGNPNFDPDLWLMAYAGDQLAGLCFSYPTTPAQIGTPSDGAHIEVLGVYSQWRRRGLAMALLMDTFKRFQDKGLRRVDLMVDAENTTNAIGLYQRAGMSITRRIISYRKELRGSSS